MTVRLLAILLNVSVVVGAVATPSILALPDVTSAMHVPPWLDALSQRDRLAFPLHAALGDALEHLGAPPWASAVQWLKAAAHARSTAEIERAAEGMALAVRRDGASGRAAAVLCNAISGGRARRQQLVAVRKADLTCGAVGARRS